MAPRRPCIIGFPGRIAICQNDKFEALGGERVLHQVVIADRSAAGGEQYIGLGVARLADARDDVVQTIARNAEFQDLRRAPCRISAASAKPLE